MSQTNLAVRLLLALSASLLAVGSAPAQDTFQVLHSFPNGANDGRYPLSNLLLNSKGDLFGITSEGGSDTAVCYGYGCGVAFEIAPQTGRWKESVLFSFSPPSGTEYIQLQSQLAMDAAGNIYGTQADGGDPTCNCGLIYQLTKTDGVWTENVLHNFLGANSGDGATPYTGLVEDAAGNLYGATGNGGTYYDSGTIFELTPNSDGSWSYNIIYDFGAGGYPTAQGPFGPLSIDSAGNIYGTTDDGGIYEDGTVFKLSPSNGGWKESVLFNFTLSYGNYAGINGVIIGPGGDLYGTTVYDGIYSLGTLYKLTPAVGYWNKTILHTFTGGLDGGNPFGGIIVSPTGALYGAGNQGGSFGYGNVFKFSETSGKWSQTVLHSFTGKTDGSRPYGGLTLDAHGNLYGTASEGGAYGYGTAFEITP
jgi:uncharacterized repeat protein (TIGR03803 family)